MHTFELEEELDDTECVLPTLACNRHRRRPRVKRLDEGSLTHHVCTSRGVCAVSGCGLWE